MERWMDITVNSYICPELLLLPKVLLQNSDYHSKWSYRMHLMCPDSLQRNASRTDKNQKLIPLGTQCH